MPTARYTLLLSYLVLAAAAGGCSTSAEVAPVSGRVTLSGRPIAGAVVTFQPISDRDGGRPTIGGSAGTTDAEGKFLLHLVDSGREGALVGKHAVTITTGKAGDSDDSRVTGELAPVTWRSGKKTFDVEPGGTDQANFELAE